MFTGLVETTGRLVARHAAGPGLRVDVQTDLEPLELGESIAVNGACLTVARRTDAGFSADISKETAEATTLGALAVGAELNLERALAAGDRLGGHIVTGHVDGVGHVEDVRDEGEARRVGFSAPEDLGKFIAAKGSITVDGVSLTVNGVEGARFHVMLVPHTLSVTTLDAFAPGAAVNLEVDLLARYVVRYLESQGADLGPGDVARALERAGRT